MTYNSNLAMPGRDYYGTNRFYTPEMMDKVIYGFMDYLTPFLPVTQDDVFRWAEYLWNSNGQYRIAMKRTSRYFITDIEIEGDISPEEKKKYKAFLNDELGISKVLGLIGDDILCYGNSIISLYKPFRRALICTKCGTEYNLNNFEYEFKDFTFSGTCRKGDCQHQGEMDVKDHVQADPSGINITRWNIYNIRLAHSMISDRSEIYLEIPSHYKEALVKGNPVAIADTPIEFINAMKKGKMGSGMVDGKDDTIFKFNSSEVLHIKEDTLCGMPNMGWGIPSVLSAMHDMFYVQILQKYNQALALDYIVPVRVITPKATQNQDPLLTANASGIAGQMNAMVKQHQKDPTKWNILPFPIEYQALSGEGLSANTKPLIDQAMANQMNSIGVPQDLFMGTLSMQAAPTALRLYEQTWGHLTHAYNQVVKWLVNKAGVFMGFEDGAEAKLTKITLADSLEKKQVWLQMMSGGMMSKETALRPWGVDPAEEQRKVIDEQEEAQELMEEAEERQMQKTKLEEVIAAQEQAEAEQQMAMGGQPGAIQAMGAMGPGVGIGGDANLPPDQLLAEAESIAQQLVLNTPEGQRKAELKNIKETNETLYALVKAKMEEIRSSARSQGQTMVLEQAKQQGGM